MSEDFKNLKQIINKWRESSVSDQFEYDKSNFGQSQLRPESSDPPKQQIPQPLQSSGGPSPTSQSLTNPTILQHPVPSDPPNQTPQSFNQVFNYPQPPIQYPPSYPQHPYPQPPYLPYPQHQPYPQPPYPQPPYPPYTQNQPPYPPYQLPYPHQAQYIPYQQAPYPHQYPYGGYGGGGVGQTINMSEEEELEEELKEEQEKARKLREYQEKQIADIQHKLQSMQVNQNNSDIDKLLREFALEKAEKEEYIRNLEQAIQAKTRTTGPTAPPTQPRSPQPAQRGLEPNIHRHCVTSNQDDKTTANLKALQEQKKDKLNHVTAVTKSGEWNTVDHQKEIKKLQEQQRKCANSGNNAASTVKARLDNVTANIASYEKGIDLAFLMDCTQSMYPWMNKAKDTIVEIADKIKTTHSHLTLRIAFVAYRDFHDKCQIEYKDFSTNAEEMKKFISTLKAEGGGDIPEDVAGGLENCLYLSWQSRARLIIHFADAPPHGTRYHNHADRYPNGDPNGRVPEVILEALCMQFKVDYYFARLNNNCDMMLEFFKPICNRQDATMKIIEIGTSVSQFVPLVMQSVSASVSNNVRRAPGRI